MSTDKRTPDNTENFFDRDSPHGKAKRVILKKILQAWIKYHSFMGYNRMIYIDGFSGTGVYNAAGQSLYTATEDYGSPVIALDCTLDCAREFTKRFEALKSPEKKADRHYRYNTLLNVLNVLNFNKYRDHTDNEWTLWLTFLRFVRKIASD